MTTTSRTLVVATISLAMGLTGHYAGAQATQTDLTALRMAWDAGDYPAALTGLEQVLGSPEAERLRAEIAELTGEPFVTRELTTDGRAVRFSATGKWLAFERGTGAATWTYLVRASTWQVADSVLGSAATVDEQGDLVAYLRATPNGSRLVLHAIGRAMDRVIDSTRLFSSPQFGEDAILYALSRRSGEAGTQLVTVSPTTLEVRELTSGSTLRADIRLLPGNRALVTQGRDPFAAGGRGGRGGRGGGRGGSPVEYVIHDLATGAERTVPGTDITVSANGRTLAYLSTQGSENVLTAMALPAGAPTVLKRTAMRIAAPAVSPDGRQVAYQLMPREDWELYVVGADGTGDRRLTHEIQHDLLPQWIDANTVFAVMGEARHRRSYAYNATTGARQRLFHNNTVRTVAPEYEWVLSADGRYVAIVAERDGDTVSPERGVYVMDLRTPVTVADLAQRVRSQRVAEERLRADAKARFAPLAATIRPATDAVSKDMIYRYAADLYAFDSKHVSQPGNAKAIAYLDSAYKSFGYETSLMWFTPGNNPRTANVIATLRGTVSPEVVYVVASHFDSRAEGPGADDNSSGTTMLLETARVLAKRPLPATVMFVSFTGEESGLLGSREFVRQIRDTVNLVGAMNNDMMGWSNDQRLDNTIRYSNPGIRDVQHGAALEFSKLITYDALYYKSTDAAAFYEAYGDIVGGFGSYPILGNPHYHQVHDVLETINFTQVAENTKANVATMMFLASVPSRVSGLEATRAGNGVTVKWKDNPEKDIRQFVVRYTDSSGMEQVARTASTEVTLPALPAGTEVRVTAVNMRGWEGWDSGRVRVP